MVDLTGSKFGHWTVLRLDTERITKRNVRCWICKCDCGNEKSVYESNLKQGYSTSCGHCYIKKEKVKKYINKHGESKTRLYSVWLNMRRRCYEKTNKRYANYGGKGIKVCDEWLDYTKFRDWALSTGYNKDADYGQCTIERLDVNGNYEPANCTWRTIQEQNRNRTTTKMLTYNGKTQCIADWEKERGFGKDRIGCRLRRGWSVEKAIETPV